MKNEFNAREAVDFIMIIGAYFALAVLLKISGMVALPFWMLLAPIWLPLTAASLLLALFSFFALASVIIGKIKQRLGC